MTRMVTNKAFALLTQSVADIVGDEAQIATSLMQAIHSGSQSHMQMARAAFDDLDVVTRRQIHGHALRLANTLH